jgi:hypothetical protein
VYKEKEEWAAVFGQEIEQLLGKLLSYSSRKKKGWEGEKEKEGWAAVFGEEIEQLLGKLLAYSFRKRKD